MVIVLDPEVGAIEGRIATAIADINNGANVHCVVVIDDLALSIVEFQHATRASFVDLAVLVDSVIYCRASQAKKPLSSDLSAKSCPVPLCL